MLEVRKMNIAEKYSRWQNLIENDKFKEVYDEFKDEVNLANWTLQNEITIAVRCLVLTNVKIHDELIRNPSLNKCPASDIFRLVEALCASIEKSWKCDGFKFIGSMYTICNYLLVEKLCKDALALGSYVFKFIDAKNRELLTDRAEAAAKSFILLFCKYAYKVEEDIKLHDTCDIWRFILSSDGFSLKASCIEKISEFFYHFAMNSLKTDSYNEIVIDLSSAYRSRINSLQLNNSILIYFSILCPIVKQLSTQLPDSKSCILRLIEKLEFPEPLNKQDGLLITACACVARISICEIRRNSVEEFLFSCEESMNALIATANEENNTFLIEAAFNFTISVFSSYRNWSGYEFYSSQLPQLLKILLILFKNVKSPNTKQFTILVQKDIGISTEPYSQDMVNVVNMTIFIMSLVYNSKDSNTIQLQQSYKYVEKSVLLVLERCVYGSNTDFERDLKLYSAIVVSCVNACRAYMRADLSEEAAKLSLCVLQWLSSFSAHLLSTSPIQLYTEMLVNCLIDSYRKLKQFTEALRTACVWVVKLPVAKKVFIDKFGALKEKLFRPDELDGLKLTCWFLLVKKRKDTFSIWKYVNLRDADMIDLLMLELKQYVLHNICCPVLVKDIIDLVETQESITTKAEFYINAIRIFVNSKKYLTETEHYLPKIESCLKLFHAKYHSSKNAMDRMIYSCILGNFHYLKFRIQLLKNRSEIEEELEIISSRRALSARAEPGMEQDTAQAYDVVNLNLTYESQQQLTALLEPAIEYWKTVVANEEPFVEKFKDSADKLDMLMFIRESALVYRLYCHKEKEISLWELLYSAAALLNETPIMIFAFTNLLSLPWNVNEEWHNTVRGKLFTADENLYIGYQLENCIRFLKDECFEEGTTILSAISEEKVKKDYILCAKYYFIIAQYQEHGHWKATNSSGLMAFKAYSKLMSWLKHLGSKFWELYEAYNLLFDVVLFMGQYRSNVWDCQRTICYLHDETKLAQKLNLPLRTSQFIINLSDIDLSMHELENCYVKLDILSTILKYKSEEKEITSVAFSKAKKPMSILHTIPVNSDVRCAQQCRSHDLAGSPLLESGIKFDKPEFIYHDPKCICTVCSDTEYQFVCCEVMKLFGMYHYCTKMFSKAQTYLNSTLDMLKCIRYPPKCTNKGSKNRVLELDLFLKIKNVDCLVQLNEIVQARATNENALMEYNVSNLANTEIFAQLTEQMHSLNYLIYEPTAERKRTVRPNRKTTKAENLPIPKTPTSQRSALVFEDEDERVKLSIMGLDVTPVPRHSRRVLFSNDETAATVCFKTPAASRRTRAPPVSSAKKSAKKEIVVWSTPPDIVINVTSSSKQKTTKSKQESGVMSSNKQKTAKSKQESGVAKTRSTRKPKQ